MEKEHREKLSPPKGQPEVPQECLLCTQEPGGRPGGEVNIVRRGGASPAGSLPTVGAPQLSPCRRLELFSRIILQEQSTQLG